MGSVCNAASVLLSTERSSIDPLDKTINLTIDPSLSGLANGHACFVLLPYAQTLRQLRDPAPDPLVGNPFVIHTCESSSENSTEQVKAAQNSSENSSEKQHKTAVKTAVKSSIRYAPVGGHPACRLNGSIAPSGRSFYSMQNS